MRYDTVNSDYNVQMTHVVSLLLITQLLQYLPTFQASDAKGFRTHELLKSREEERKVARFCLGQARRPIQLRRMPAAIQS
jgi:hypothetical protein